MNFFLTGAGHFGFGFIFGTVLFLCLAVVMRKSLKVQMYGPFLPFVFGFFAVLPYPFFFKETCDLPAIANVFLFYPWAHCQPLLIKFLGNLHLVAVLCGVIYGLILLRYIGLVKSVRRHGWKSRR